MVDNLAEKVDECPGSLSIVCLQLGPRKLSVIRSSGVFAIQGLKSTEGQSGLSELSVISWVSAVEGRPFKWGSTVYILQATKASRAVSWE